jgi:hypothetical protein
MAKVMYCNNAGMERLHSSVVANPIAHNLHMFTNPTGISTNPATCASTMAGISQERRQAPPHGAGPAVGV